MSVSEKSPAPASIPTETGGQFWNFPARPITPASRAGLIALWTAVALVIGYSLWPDLEFLDRAPAEWLMTKGILAIVSVAVLLVAWHLHLALRARTRIELRGRELLLQESAGLAQRRRRLNLKRIAQVAAGENALRFTLTSGRVTLAARGYPMNWLEPIAAELREHIAEAVAAIPKKRFRLNEEILRERSPRMMVAETVPGESMELRFAARGFARGTASHYVTFGVLWYLGLGVMTAIAIYKSRQDGEPVDLLFALALSFFALVGVLIFAQAFKLATLSTRLWGDAQVLGFEERWAWSSRLVTFERRCVLGAEVYVQKSSESDDYYLQIQQAVGEPVRLLEQLNSREKEWVAAYLNEWLARSGEMAKTGATETDAVVLEYREDLPRIVLATGPDGAERLIIRRRGLRAGEVGRFGFMILFAMFLLGCSLLGPWFMWLPFGCILLTVLVFTGMNLAPRFVRVEVDRTADLVAIRFRPGSMRGIAREDLAGVTVEPINWAMESGHPALRVMVTTHSGGKRELVPAIGNDEARWLAAWLRTWPD